MIRWLLLLCTLILGACAPSPRIERPTPNPSAFPAGLPTPAVPASTSTPSQNLDYPLLGLAPEIVGSTWLNTTAPLRLADLIGKVVLVDMWTFG